MTPSEQSNIADELFVDDDGSTETCWLLAEYRSADAAVAIAARFVGPFVDSVSAALVHGRVESTSDGWRFTKDDDGDLLFWEVCSS